MSNKRNNRRRDVLIIGAVGIAFIIFISVFGAINMDKAPVFTLVLYAGLIVVTMFYAYYSMETANAAREQADASVEMAEEMREQTIMASRPVIILRAARTESIPSELTQEYFEMYNAGNGPAIDVQVVLLDQWGKSLNGQRKEFLRAGETMEFYTDLPPNLNGRTFYVVSEYQGILSRSAEETWYQTWLLCKVSVTGKVISGKLEFHEVCEKNRKGIFKTEFNNGRNSS